MNLSRIICEFIHLDFIHVIIYTDFIMKNLHETLGSLIRRRRKELKMTAEELAIKVQVDRTYLSKMERHNFIPSLEVLMRLNAVLDLNTFIINDPAIRNKIKFPLTPEVFEKVYFEHTKSQNEVAGLFWEQIVAKKETSDKLFILDILSTLCGPEQLKNKSYLKAREKDFLNYIRNWRKAYAEFIKKYQEAEIQLILKDGILKYPLPYSNNK